MDNIQFNRKTRQEIQYRYILNAIQIANPTVSFHSHKEMLDYIINEFYWDNETSVDAKLTATTFAKWLEQKQICIAIPHDKAAIIAIGNAWGFCRTKNSTDRFVATWYERIANKFIQMCYKLNVVMF